MEWFEELWVMRGEKVLFGGVERREVMEEWKGGDNMSWS